MRILASKLSVYFLLKRLSGEKMPTGCPVLWTKTLFSLHSFKFVQRIVSALGGRGGPALNQAPGGLQVTFPEDRKSGLGAVL